MAVLGYPANSLFKKTIMSGMIKALKRIGKIPPKMIFNHAFFKNLPTMYVPNAEISVASDPKMMSGIDPVGRFEIMQPMYNAGTASGKNSGKIQNASAGRI